MRGAPIPRGVLQRVLKSVLRGPCAEGEGGAPPSAPPVYATWNPSDKRAGVTLSNGNLTASGVDEANGVRATIGKSSGKWYWEVKCTDGYNYGAQGVGTLLARMDQSGSPGAYYSRPGDDAYGYGLSLGNGQKLHAAIGAAYHAGAIANGVTVGVLLNMDDFTIGWQVAGVDQGIAYSGLSGTFYPQLGGSWWPPSTYVANFGASAFDYPVPTGYNAGLYVPGAVSPLSIAGCVLWLDADDAATLTAPSGISAWADKSASGLVFAQADAGLRPANNIVDFGGLNAVDFGSNQTKWLASAVDLAIPASSTVFVVAYLQNFSNNYRCIALQKGSAAGALNAAAAVPYWTLYGVVNTNPVNNGYWQASHSGPTYFHSADPPPFTANARGLGMMRTNGTINQSRVRHNGVEKTIASAGASTPTDMVVNTLGSSDSLYKSCGSIAEIIVYDSALSNDAILAVEAYLKTKWSTP